MNRLLDSRVPAVSSKPISSVGVILHLPEFGEFDPFRMYFKSINLRQNRIKIIAYSEDEPQVEKLWDSYYHAKDFGWSGKINNMELETFLDQPMDMLISYHRQPVLELDHLTARSKANFKVGLADTDKRLYDLIIDLQPKEFELFTTELTKYLTVLNKLP